MFAYLALSSAPEVLCNETCARPQAGRRENVDSAFDDVCQDEEHHVESRSIDACLCLRSGGTDPTALVGGIYQALACVGECRSMERERWDDLHTVLSLCGSFAAGSREKSCATHICTLVTERRRTSDELLLASVCGPSSLAWLAYCSRGPHATDTLFS